MEESIIAIADAYDDLTPQSFAIWMRLMVADDEDLIGYERLAKVLRFSLSQTKVHFQELRRKRYIQLQRQNVNTRKTKLFLTKRAIISGPTRFVKLSSTILQSIDQKPFENSSCGKQTDKNDSLNSVALKKPLKKAKTNVKKLVLSCSDPKSSLKKPLKKPSKTVSDAPSKVQIKRKENKTAGTIAGNLSSKKSAKSKKQSEKKKQDEVEFFEDGSELLNDFFEESNSSCTSDEEEKSEKGIENSKTQFCFVEPVVKPLGFTKGEDKYTNTIRHKIKDRSYDGRKGRKEESYSTNNNQTNKIDLNKFQDKISKNKQTIKQQRTRQSRSDWLTNVEFSWDRIESPRPKFDFNVSGKKAEKFIGILERDKRDTARRSLVEKIGQEFADVYSRYRKMIQETDGKRRSFVILDREMKHAKLAGELCLLKGITPVQLLKHWHKNIGNFAKGSMKYPPLHFLASPANVESALCCLEDIDSQKKNMDEVPSHGFCDVSKLDPRLRRGLMRAGFDLKTYNDRFLLSIQAAAQAIADGANVYYGGETRPLVDWAIENLYGGTP